MVTVQNVSHNQYVARYMGIDIGKCGHRTILFHKDGVLFKDTGEIVKDVRLNAPTVRLSNGRTIVVAPKEYNKWNELFFYEKKGLFRNFQKVSLGDQEKGAIETYLKIGSQRSYKDGCIQYFSGAGSFLEILSNKTPSTAPSKAGVTATVLKDKAAVCYSDIPTEMFHMSAARPAAKLKLNNGKTLIVAPRLHGKGWVDLAFFEKKGLFNRDWKEVKPTKEEELAVKIALIKNDGLNKIPLIGKILAIARYHYLSNPLTSNKKYIYHVDDKYTYIM